MKAPMLHKMLREAPSSLYIESPVLAESEARAASAFSPLYTGGNIEESCVVLPEGVGRKEFSV